MIDFKKHLPRDMQAGLSCRATTASLRRIRRAQRIALGLREETYPDFGKRVKKIVAKMKSRGIKEISCAAVAAKLQEKLNARQ